MSNDGPWTDFQRANSQGPWLDFQRAQAEKQAIGGGGRPAKSPTIGERVGEAAKGFDELARAGIRGVAGTGLDVAVGATAEPAYWLDRLLGGPQGPTPLEASRAALDRAVPPPTSQAGKVFETASGAGAGFVTGEEAAGVAARAVPTIGKLGREVGAEVAKKGWAGLPTRVMQAMATDKWNLQHIKDILKTAGAKPLEPGTQGQAAIAHAQDALGERYNQLYGKLVGDLNAGAKGKNAVVLRGEQFAGSFKDKLNYLKTTAANEQMALRGKLNNFIDTKILDRFRASGLTSGASLQKIAGDLRMEIENYSKHGATVAEREYANALKLVQSDFRTMIKTVNGPLASQLRQVDRAYAALDAASRAAGRDVRNLGRFTPEQLLQEIKRKSSRRMFGAGRAAGQKAAQAAQEEIHTKGVGELAKKAGGASARAAGGAAGGVAEGVRSTRDDDED